MPHDEPDYIDTTATVVRVERAPSTRPLAPPPPATTVVGVDWPLVGVRVVSAILRAEQRRQVETVNVLAMLAAAATIRPDPEPEPKPTTAGAVLALLERALDAKHTARARRARTRRRK